MRRTLLVLLACVVIVAVVLFVGTLPGAVRFEAGSLSVDAAAPVIAFAALLGLALFYLALRLLGVLIRLPRRLRERRAARRRRDGDLAVTRALVALAAGNQAEAPREAARARALLGDTPQTLLLAAQAGRLAGREDEAAAHYETLAAHPQAALLGLRGLMRLARARGDRVAAMALAERAAAAYPNSAWLREERGRLAVQAGDWTGALALAGPDAPRTAFGTAAAAASDDPDQALKLARAAFKADSGFAPAALAYATRLRATAAAGKADAVLQQAWTARPHPDIAAALLAAVQPQTAAARYAAAQRLTQANAADPESQLVLGRAALDAGDLPAARAAADAATTLDQHRAHALLADVEQRIHPDSAATRAAWQRAATAKADPAWQCTRCGNREPSWTAKCTSCGTPGALSWDAWPMGAA